MRAEPTELYLTLITTFRIPPVVVSRYLLDVRHHCKYSSTVESRLSRFSTLEFRTPQFDKPSSSSGTEEFTDDDMQEMSHYISTTQAASVPSRA